MWSAVKVGNINGIYKYRLPLVRVMCENYEGQKMTYFALVKKTWWQLMQANTRKSKNRRNMSKKINKIERRPKYGNQTHSFGLKDFSVYRTYIHDRFCRTWIQHEGKMIKSGISMHYFDLILLSDLEILFLNGYVEQ